MRISSIFFAILLMTAAAAGNSSAQEGEGRDKPWLVSLNLNYGSFSTDDVDNDGRQALGYAQVIYDKENWGAAVTGAYASTSYKTEAGEGRFETSTFRDTVVSGYCRTGSHGVEARFGLDVTLPTGKRAFPSDELRRIIAEDVGQDLLLVNSYGTGLNFNPNAAVTYKTGMVTWGAGVKYLFTGEYDPTTDVENDDFDPGDTLTAILSALVDGGEAGKLLLTATYIHAGADKQGGREVFREGDALAVEARGIRQWTESWRGTLGLIFSSQQKNERLGDGDVLRSETGNANGNSIEILTANVYRHTSKVMMTGVAGYKNVDANGYSEGDELYDGGRNLFYVEPGGAYYLRDDMYILLKARYTRINDKKDAFSSADAAYDVINVEAGVVYSF